LTPIVLVIGFFGLSNTLSTFIFDTLVLTGVVPFDFGFIFLSGILPPFFILPVPENILSTFTFDTFVLTGVVPLFGFFNIRF
tara:strand:- start:181 stop:426 length:246 start_codon:yes stop_codon:yes gene_type:complete